jgi:hypothetical protein
MESFVSSGSLVLSPFFPMIPGPLDRRGPQVYPLFCKSAIILLRTPDNRHIKEYDTFLIDRSLP